MASSQTSCSVDFHFRGGEITAKCSTDKTRAYVTIDDWPVAINLYMSKQQAFELADACLKCIEAMNGKPEQKQTLKDLVG